MTNPPVADVEVGSYYRVGLSRPILEEIRWQIFEGEHWALIGENGAGKSSLLSILAGDIWPSRGVVRVLGHEYGHVDKRELKKRIGVVSAALYGAIPGHDTGLEVVASGMSARIGQLGELQPDEREHAYRALERVGATAVADKCYGVMSQGERQRVMIARALVRGPDLLILDEPCAGLDPVARERFLSDAERLAREPRGPTQVHVTHHVEEIPGFITHALVLKEGRILSQGPTHETITDDNMSRAYGAACRVTVVNTNKGRRFSLHVTLSEGNP